MSLYITDDFYRDVCATAFKLGAAISHLSPDTDDNIACDADAVISLLECAAERERTMRTALENAYAHITLLSVGEKPPRSNAEVCGELGDVLYPENKVQS